ncbi:MAG: hypothetical protein H6983_05175 [Ectothiorhodospiraceae bacterium]|nr:hypothetical protein [Ectothiorhodospiraceae bacterium]
MSTTTVVTGLFHLGRDALDAPFRREESHYVQHFTRLLALPHPLCVYTEPRYESLVWAHRDPADTRVIVVDPGLFSTFPGFERIESIRTDPAWRGQAGWLDRSPQAALPGYVPMVMSKLPWLAEQAEENPFASDCLVWLDAGIGHTVDLRLLVDDQVLNRLPALADRFVALAYPYPGAGEIHGFARDGMRAFCDGAHVARVTRGGFFGGRPEHVLEVNARYAEILAATLDAGFLGTEESLLTILCHRHPRLFRVYPIAADGLVAPFFARLRDPSTPVALGQGVDALDDLELWLLSFNAPAQLATLLGSLASADPAFLECGRRVLIDNSTDASTRAAYDALCARFELECIREGNLGITGARVRAAQELERSGGRAMLWFEDDMLICGRERAGALCRNGLPRHVPDLLRRVVEIATREGIDLLKLSFTEFFGAHDRQWAWYGLSAERRRAHFAAAAELTEDEVPPPTTISRIGVHDGLAYAVGDVHYSNWPHLLTRRGSARLFADTGPNPSEHTSMAAAFELARRGELASAVLLASPVEHARHVAYDAAERRES